MLRLLWCTEVASFIALLSDTVRDVLFPDGTTRPQVLIFLLILIVWYDVIRIKRRVDA